MRVPLEADSIVGDCAHDDTIPGLEMVQAPLLRHFRPCLQRDADALLPPLPDGMDEMIADQRRKRVWLPLETKVCDECGYERKANAPRKYDRCVTHRIESDLHACSEPKEWPHWHAETA